MPATAVRLPIDWFQGCGAGNSSFHGTHVAGTIGAVPNNGIGIAGINWVSKIVPVRVLGKCGGYTSDIVAAIVWAAGGSVSGIPANANPARVLSISLGGGGSCDPASQNAINTALSLGAVVVVAAGNENDNAASHQSGELQRRHHGGGDEQEPDASPGTATGARRWKSPRRAARPTAPTPTFSPR